MNRSELMFKLNLDMDDIEVVKQLAKDFEEWCEWNKSFETIEVIEPENFNIIIVVHELWDWYVKASDSWEFLSDVKYFLKDYSDYSKEDYDYMIDFWKEKLNGLLEIQNRR